jgi:single-stranded-DNA-specific exonuclease
MIWDIQSKKETTKSTPEELLEILLRNRNINGEKARELFLFPKLEYVTAKNVGIDQAMLEKAVKRIQKAIDSKEQIVVFGDYDVDGICASAILWETLHNLGANVMPYIPHRVEEGYGLSVPGITNLESKINDTTLIITVDNGIVANDAVNFAREKGIDVIITDHHLPHDDENHTIPNAYAIVHTTKLCGAGVAWILSKSFLPDDASRLLHNSDHLVFAALATVADMVPLIEGNRAIVKAGIAELRKTKRLGLRELFDEAGIEQESLQTYHIGHLIGPRLNAAGRMESAMDSLRLLCTRDRNRAKELARLLGDINKLRQDETLFATEHALEQITLLKEPMEKLLFIADASYEQGVIGLVAGKLVEKFYRPSIVIAIGEIHSKASVRSVKGFNIIEFLRLHSEHFVNVGGHPMAAGFTVETAKISLLQSELLKSASEMLTDEQLTKRIAIDCELPLSSITDNLYKTIQQLAPFGMGNPEPVFASTATIKDVRIMGRDGKHLKLKLCAKNADQNEGIEAVGFGMGSKFADLKVGNEITFAYVLDENIWNGRRNLQLRIKDLAD